MTGEDFVFMSLFLYGRILVLLVRTLLETCLHHDELLYKSSFHNYESACGNSFYLLLSFPKILLFSAVTQSQDLSKQIYFNKLNTTKVQQPTPPIHELFHKTPPLTRNQTDHSPFPPSPTLLFSLFANILALSLSIPSLMTLLSSTCAYVE